MLGLISLIYIVGGWLHQWDTQQPWLFLAWLMVICGGISLNIGGSK